VIAPRKRPWFRSWFSGHAVGRMRATFASVEIFGLSHLRDALKNGPVVVVSNHVAWWDPLVTLVLTEQIVRCDSYALMDATNLKKLPFFGLVGAIGVDLTHPSDGAAAILYTARLLKSPNQLVWIYPQGRERPPTVRPLGFRGGSAEIARVAKAHTVPIALRYEFMEVEKPRLLIHIGAPIAPERNVARATEAHERAVIEGLDHIDRVLLEGQRPGFETVIAAPQDRWGALAARALAWLTKS
jgi:1-acyl-sn-glycerol-3-phosphate acyltransferase